MSQEQEVLINYPAVDQGLLDYVEAQLKSLITFSEDAGVVFTVDWVYTQTAVGHYKMVPHVRRARILDQQVNAMVRAMDKAGIDPLTLEPKEKND